MSYPSIWFKGMKAEEKEEFIKFLKTSVIVPKVQEILQSWLRETQGPTRRDYDNPAWAYRQAHDNGLSEAFLRVLKLFDQGEPN